MKQASIRLPAKTTTRKCWIGSYGGHFDIIVVFNKKPTKGKKGQWNEGQYDSLTNKDIIAGTFDCESFNEWFGTNIQPDATEIKEVEQYEVTAIWDEYNQIVGLITNAD